MMKNVLVLNVEEIAATFRDGMLEFFNTHQEETSIEEFAADISDYASRLKSLVSSDNSICLRALRREFRDGFTTMMLKCEDFDQIEKWADAKEDFHVVICREDGSAVGVLQLDDFNW